MTWALCMNCGNIKHGALSPCPKCRAAPTDNPRLDLTFSDARLDRATLEQLAAVIAEIHKVADDPQQRFAAFIYYVSEAHPSLLRTDLPPDEAEDCRHLLQGLTLPPVTLVPSRRARHRPGRPADRRWWSRS